MNTKFQNALQLKEQKCPPVWMMRQAGRYHKHYQGLRAQYSFMELCKKPKIAAEVALGPILDFDFDVSILFSDLLFPLEAFGMGLEYTDAGPRLGFSLDSESFKKLRTVEEAIKDLSFQGEAVECTRAVLPKDKSLIGFVGGPWTLFVYAMEGGHAGNLLKSKTSFPLFKAFCEKMVPLLIKNIDLQLKAGCEAVMIFDTAAGECSPLLYKTFIEPELKKVFEAHPGKCGYYSKGTTQDHFTGDSFIKSKSVVGTGFDHRFDLPNLLKSRSTIGFTQGNFDQALLFLNESDFEREMDRYLEPYLKMSVTERTGWVSGLGHGVLPKTPEANVKRFVQKIRESF